jgi:DNA polymerase elongation subunit (family B)
VKILLLDIETAPNLAYVWGLFKENIPLARIVASGHVLCWAAKWHGEKKTYFSSIQKRKPLTMLDGIHRMLGEADAVVHYNGKSFDIPTLNKEFVTHGMKPPEPYKQIDLLQIVRAEFRFPSNKLDYVAKALGLGEKVRHPGFEMWVKCMANEAAAWKDMERYNRQDVNLLEQLYDRLNPWIRTHPNHGAFQDISCCPKCGSEKFQQRGFAVTQIMKYPRYQCTGCGGWFRGNKSVSHDRHRERMSNIAA